MGDYLGLPERNCARTPMQWSNEPHGGFTKNEKPLMPVIDQGPYGFEYVNVAKQKRDPNSFMDWTERIIRMRKEIPEIGWGDFEALETGAKEVLAICYEWLSNSAVFVHNFGGIPLEIRFDLGAKYRVLLEPYGYRWYRVGGLDYIMKRKET